MKLPAKIGAAITAYERAVKDAANGDGPPGAYAYAAIEQARGHLEAAIASEIDRARRAGQRARGRK